MSDHDKVICPSCCNEFVAVPVNVQAQLAAERLRINKFGLGQLEDLLARNACVVVTPSVHVPLFHVLPNSDIIADLTQKLAALLAEREKAEPVAEFKADEDGYITLRALDAWQGETGNLYTHPPVPPEGAGYD